MYIHNRQFLKLSAILIAICLILSGCFGKKNDNSSSDDTTSRYIIDQETGQVIDNETGEIVSNAIVDSSTGNIIDANTGEVIQTPSQEQSSTTSKTTSDITVEYDSDDETTSWETTEQNKITLNGDSIAFSGKGATLKDNVLTITQSGTYSISGKLNDGQIVVNTTDNGNVGLVLDNADINCSYSAPIFIKNSEKTVIVLSDGSTNRITDGKTYKPDESGEPNAAIFAKNDLTINGTGKLVVNANCRNGIESRDELKITGGNITVNSANHGLRGKDCVAIKNADITINAKGDGIQSDNEKSSEKGFIVIEGNSLNITSGEDGIQAYTSVAISGGNISIVSGGGSGTPISDISTKGIKAAVDIIIENATINIDSSDDCIHSNSTLTVNSGNLKLATYDDAIHADESIVINGGDINVTKAHEGLEGAVITINGGNVRINASNDGVNASGADTQKKNLIINDGYVYINAGDDGIDSNGSINVAGGTIIVNSYGPDSDAIEFDDSFNITGGLIVAAGYSTDSLKDETGSSQYSLRIKFPKLMAAGTAVHIQGTDREEIVTFVPSNQYKCFFVSSPKLKKGVGYNIYLGGNVSGDSQDGLYAGGYSGGSRYTQVTVN